MRKSIFVAAALALVGVVWALRAEAAYTTLEATLTVTGTSSNARLSTGGKKMLVCDQPVYVKFERTSALAVATSADIPIASGEKFPFTIQPGVEYIAALRQSGSGTCRVWASDSKDEPTSFRAGGSVSGALSAGEDAGFKNVIVSNELTVNGDAGVAGSSRFTGRIEANGNIQLDGGARLCLGGAGDCDARWERSGSSVSTPNHLNMGGVLTLNNSSAAGVVFSGSRGGVISAATADAGVDSLAIGSGGTTVASATKFNSNGLLTNYKGVATAGNGLPAIQAYGTALANSTDATTIATLTAPAVDTLYEVGGFFQVTAWTSSTVAMELAFTSCAGTSTTINMSASTNASSVAQTISSTGRMMLFTTTICADASSAVTLQTNFGGTATADFYGHIKAVGP